MNRENEIEKTLDWYKAQAKELADIRRGLFPLMENNDGDEYYPDKVIQEFKRLLPQVGQAFKGLNEQR